MTEKQLIAFIARSDKALQQAKEKRQQDMKKIGRELFIHRMDARMQQQTMARHMKCSQPHVHFIENGKNSTIAAETVIQWFDILRSQRENV
jgi:DNA-binding XRE family transcriptional regulator